MTRSGMGSQIFSEEFFRKVGRLSIILVFLVIFLGGLVRVTGSGMGCPDWPKCFGKWIPPTDISQLPPDYKEIYKKPGHVVADFNVAHTYTEYINRLSGASLGLVLFITTVSSFQFFKRKRWITVMCVLALLLTGYQGWIGARVVDTYLAGWMITIHMLLALAIIAIVMVPVYGRHAAERSSSIPMRYSDRLSALGMLGILLFQIAVGTQVREEVDGLTAKMPQISDWNQALGSVFDLHKLLSLLVIGMSVFATIRFSRIGGRDSEEYRISALTLILLVAQGITGVMNAMFDFPAVARVLHIVLGTVAFGTVFYLIMLLWTNKIKLSKEGVTTL